MELTTKGLVLREVQYKEADKILTVLTQDAGKLTVSARGCRKKGSAIAAVSQLLVWSELTLTQRQGRWSLKEGLTQRRFDGVRSDLEKLALGSFFAEVAEVLVGEEQPDQPMLSLLLNSLHALEQLPLPPRQIKAAFCWKAMALAGYEPLCQGCGVCGREEPQEGRIHLLAGMVHCAGCPVGDGRSLPLSPAALSALRYILYGDARRLFSFRVDPVSLRQLDLAGEAYLTTQLERGFRTLEFYQSLKKWENVHHDGTL
ncbi:MAG TPA: DNA repair protein RecO [Clostridiales bacterium]|nr:DNA repair protein RecO [Clostridiales bacterium]